MYLIFPRVVFYFSLLGLVLFAGCAADPQWHDGDHRHGRGETQTVS